MDKYIRKNIFLGVILLTLFCIMMFLFYQPKYKTGDFSGYHKLDKTYKHKNYLTDKYKQLDKYKKQSQSIKLVLYKTGCSDCNQVEGSLVWQIKRARLMGQKVVLLDINKMNSQQISEFKQNYPNLLYQKKWISTPSVAYLKVKNNQWQVKSLSNDGNLDDMLKILKQ